MQPPPLYIRGGMNGWGSTPQWQLAYDEATNTYSIDVENFAGEFKIADATWGNDNWGGSYGALALDKEYVLSSGGGNLKTDGTWTKATITFDYNTKTLKAVGASQENEYDTVYLVGDFGSGWNEDLTTYPLTLKAGTENVWEGKYNLTAATSYFKMKAGVNIYGTGGNDIAVAVGTEYTASQSGNAFSIGSGEYTFSFVLDKNADTGVLTVSGKEVFPETMYVIGNVNGASWNPTNVLALTKTADGIFEGKEVEIGTEMGTAYGYFSFCQNEGTAGDWASIGARYGATEADFAPSFTEANAIMAGDQSFMVEAPVKLDITLDLTTMTVKIAKSEEGEDPDPVVEAPEALYIVGNLCNWLPENALLMTKDGYTFTIENVEMPGADGTEDTYFSFTTAANLEWADMTRYGAEVNDTPAIAGTPVTFVESEHAFKAAQAIYNVTVDFKEMTVTLTKVDDITIDPTPAYVPETLYVLGNVNDTNWSTADGVAMAKNGNEFSIESINVNGANAEGKGYFSFSEFIGADWGAVNGGNRWGAAEADTPIEFTESNNATAPLTLYAVNINASSAKSFMMESGVYSMVVSFENETPVLSVTKISNGVEEVAVDANAPVEYFNLQGVRVAEPANGVYIRRQGASVSKVFVK